MDMEKERFVWFVDSKNKRAAYCYLPQVEWVALPEHPKAYELAVLLQKELRELDLENNNLSADEIIKKVMKALQNEF